MSVHDTVKDLLRELGTVKLVCVTKTVEPAMINEAIRAGATIIGENRVQELERKLEELLPSERHLIGHLQTNKVRKAVQLFDVIQSADSLKLLQDIDRKAGSLGKVQKLLLQVNISEESQKFGFAEGELGQVLAEVRSLRHVRVEGLMCMAPFVPAEETRPYFRRMKTLFGNIRDTYGNAGNIDIRELSMGMSGDYRVAIEEGATMVRLGSSIFGDREY
ncbi:YggS family pyridoxal phosphate-dependent enzyme [Methanolobus chelungpuianus]|nr:YggS family pyridoxal phosphate-dependent enzyme [Methanolobus chelungpuianus]